ncbi:MAG: glycoside hydrolase family 2 protein [Bacteroidales bacterium]|nr:glycoside hydrolase family 2 protein [Bacteroidales bacterium]
MILRLKLFLLQVVFLLSIMVGSSGQLYWPAITSQNKPWTRWWWLGSTVDTADLEKVMDQYSQAGLGGLEIVPIYGVSGDEDKFIPYLSPTWMDVIDNTLSLAGKLDLGIDMANGTGWPFGGKFVKDEDAARCVYLKHYELHEGESITEKITFRQPVLLRTAGAVKPEIAQLRQPVSANEDMQSLAIDQIKFPTLLKPQVVMAYGKAGSLDITGSLDDSCRLRWKAPTGTWEIIALFNGIHGKLVERAAPGAEGYAIDHFSQDAVRQYLQHFDSAFTNRDISSLRCFFNDSYEVDDASGQADWTPDLLTGFRNRRGYDLRDYLPALLLTDTSEAGSRVIYDYRLTVSEMLLDNFTQTWRLWAAGKEVSIRNQAHGSPANILDLYAASDIPETEGRDILRFKFASSAANIAGKRLISAEAATWLKDHFLSTLGDVKRSVDAYFLGGVNHILYHGTAYSPPSDPWPGRLFYATVHFQPVNPFWVHFPALNQYVARCQSFLQQGHADNDVLLYYPLSDRLSNPGNQLLRHFDGMEREFEGSGFREVAEYMLQKGYAFDYISDKQIQKLDFKDNLIRTETSGYQTILVPDCKYMPVETLRRLFELADAGARIIFFKSLVEDVPGLANLQKNRSEFQQFISELAFKESSRQDIRQARYGKGYFITGSEINDLLTFAGIRREPMADHQIQFARRKIDENTLYFVVNNAPAPWEGWLPLQCNALSAGLFDALTGRNGIAQTRRSSPGILEVFVQLKPGASLLMEAFTENIQEQCFLYARKKGPAVPLTGKWKVSFADGGPVLPDALETETLGSWTGWTDPDLKFYSGIATYSILFAKPKVKAKFQLLDLGTVRESAEVWLNGKYLATLIGGDYSTMIGSSLLRKNNLLEIRVANSMANRIIYMDQQGIPYRKFYNVNFPAYDKQNRDANGLFTAVNWEPLPSGLLGPVTLTPLK